MIETYLGNSELHGIGLFAAKKIQKGTLVWVFDSKLDLCFSDEEINKLSPVSKEQVLNYAYFNESKGLYVLCGDDARFVNHSDNPSLDSIGFNNVSEEGKSFAARDINEGEEITENYSLFEKHDRNVQYGVL